MNRLLKLAVCATVTAAAVPAVGSALPTHSAAFNQVGPGTSIVKAGCYEDCEHSRWRSHNRWGSNCCEYSHNRWRSHYRWGSYGGYWHDRWRSHYRLGSYHYLWRRDGYRGSDE